MFTNYVTLDKIRLFIDIGLRLGIARTQFPANKNYALELSTFGIIASVNLSIVQ
jgi:hypothetical protein